MQNNYPGHLQIVLKTYQPKHKFSLTALTEVIEDSEIIVVFDLAIQRKLFILQRVSSFSLFPQMKAY